MIVDTGGDACESLCPMGSLRSTISRKKPAATVILLFAASLLLTGCGGSLYRVKPVVQPTGPLEGGRAAAAGGIGLRARALLRDEESQELFESNLPLAGLLPVRVELSNEGGAELALKRLRFRLRGTGGRNWKPVSTKQTAARILAANAVTLYNPNARKRFEEALGRHAFDLKTPLAPRERRRGLLFFQTPDKRAVEAGGELMLTLEGLEQPLALRLD